MADTLLGSLRPDESAGVKDDDFVVESHSAPNAFDPPPEDTTTIDDAPAPVAVADVAETLDEDADGDEVSRSRVEPAVAGAPAPKPGKANKVPLAKRTAQLKHEVDTLTHQKHRTRTELEADERRLADVRRELATLQGHRDAPPAKEPATAAAPGREAAADAAMPAHPQYRDFETDEAYEAAVAKWRSEDVPAWQTARDAALEQRITSGVDSRLRGAGDHAAFREAVGRLEATKAAVIEAHPDWDEKREVLSDLRSAWYDPRAHKGTTTPFLSDLARTLLMQGNPEGGELLYWLGSDPDRAQAVADLHPGVIRMTDGTLTSPLRDALLSAPSVIPLLDHFATDAGQREWAALKQMHPIRMNQAIGLLSARLAGASSGSPGRPHPITSAHPSARPPAGTPGARGSGGGPGQKQSFEDWMQAEDAKELAARKRAAGLAG